MKKRLELLLETFVPAIFDALEPLLTAPSGLAFYEFERSIFQSAITLSAQTVGVFLCILHSHTSWPVTIAANARLQRPSLIHKGMRITPVRLLDGSLVQLKTPYLIEPPEDGRNRKVGQRGESGTGSYPVLEALGIQHKATPMLRSEVA